MWIAPTGDTAWAHSIADDLMAGGGEAADIEVVFGSYDLPGSALLDVVEVMDRLVGSARGRPSSRTRR